MLAAVELEREKGFDMRHRLGLRKLNRTSSHRLAMFRNMTNSLLRHEVIKTTLPKAKELRRVAEPIITLGKKPSLSNRRLAFNRLRDREMVVKLFDVLGPRYAQRNGGYLRILKSGFRLGDNAPMALVELMDRPENGGSRPSQLGALRRRLALRRRRTGADGSRSRRSVLDGFPGLRSAKSGGMSQQLPQPTSAFQHASLRGPRNLRPAQSWPVSFHCPLTRQPRPSAAGRPAAQRTLRPAPGG